MADKKRLTGLKCSFVRKISITLYGILMTTEVTGLQLVRITIPENVIRGETITLECKFTMDNNSIYNLKWYRRQEEFYRFTPAEQPSIKVFAQDGLDIDVNNSKLGVVVLRNVSQNTSGDYSCEISSISPNFYVYSNSRYLKILDMPEATPTNCLEETRVSFGDTAPSAILSPFILCGFSVCIYFLKNSF